MKNYDYTLEECIEMGSHLSIVDNRNQCIYCGKREKNNEEKRTDDKSS